MENIKFLCLNKCALDFICGSYMPFGKRENITLDGQHKIDNNEKKKYKKYNKTNKQIKYTKGLKKTA